MPKRARFIVLEGIDGSGISTHAEQLRDWLLSEGYSVVLTAEPTDGPVGVLVRQILRGHVNIPKRPDILALLYAADRLYHVYTLSYGIAKDETHVGIKSALQEGKIVISNRYLLSSLAYQGVAEAGVQVTLDWINTVNNPEIPGRPDSVLPIPDLVIFLDVPPEVTMRRIRAGRQRYELFENYRDLKKVYEKFNEALRRVPTWKIVRIRGTTPRNREKSVKEVQNEIRRKVGEFLKDEGPEETVQAVLKEPKSGA